MSCGSLPPVPDLIPISAFQKKQCFNDNRLRECAPCESHSEVMGEQRSRRTGKQPAIDLIDTTRSRGLSAAPQAPFRKTRPERHRKSDRRREHRSGRKRSTSKQRSRSRVSSPERPVNPRVNPIFVWVRQEDSHIVEVKCEDYDKRNRLLITKTAQGWRAFPRTETILPGLREADDRNKPRVRKQRKTHKVKRKSTGVQVDEENSETETLERPTSPTWTDPVNVESHLPSHTIHIPKRRSPSPEAFAQPDENVNSTTNSSVQKPVIECNINKTCDVSPLDNLLAVAELEFNHQLQSGEWGKCTETDNNDLDNDADINDIREKTDEYIDNIEQLNNFIDSCTNSDSIDDTQHIIESFNDVQSKTDDCDYNEDDDNNLAMVDILNRLEQSLRSPEVVNSEMSAVLNECVNLNSETLHIKEHDVFIYEQKEVKFDNTNMYIDKPEHTENETEVKCSSSISPDVIVQSTSDDVVHSQSDLSAKNSYEPFSEDIQPTDLSLPKRKQGKSPPPRPQSQDSETIQSPQPSGIPAVPPSPDIFSNMSNNKTKSIFLETLLSNSCQKNSETSEVSQEKEPLDLGNFRKSASPTVTCSEEVKNKSYFDGGPSAKKLKVEDITLKKLLNVEPATGNIDFGNKIFSNEHGLKETSRLLELLTSPVDLDPVAQLNQVLSDNSLNIPDLMLVPKKRLSKVLSSPAREIPSLLIDQPELRLSQALVYPNLLQNPDIMVMTLSQLQMFIHQRSQLLPSKDLKVNEDKPAEISDEKPSPKYVTDSSKSLKQQESKEERPTVKETAKKVGHISELANDIDAATNAAFNQMMWLPYLNQLESNSFNNNSDFLKLLTILPSYSGHTPDMSHLMGINRFMQPASFPMQTPFNCNQLEFSTWQEAMLQANLLRPKNQYDVFNSKNLYRDYGDKNCGKKQNYFNLKNNHKTNNLPNIYPPNMPSYHSAHNTTLNMPACYQSPARTNLQIPQYNPILSHRNVNTVHKNKSSHVNKNSGNKADAYMQRTEERKISHAASALRTDQQSMNSSLKMNNKSVSSFTHQDTVNKLIVNLDSTKPHSAMQPIDLSGSTASGRKLKVRQHLIDPSHTARLLKHDDIPEVGSTTASIEEMQDAQKYLWHPLFGNQKNYTSPWNWTTVTATGE